MPPRSLFSDISEGIFGRLNELTAEQTKRDDDKRGQVLNLLTGMLDKVEPESQGMLLGHIGDVMKLKGKERGLWDRLTMKDMDATEQALGGRAQEILGGLVGPGTARQKRGSAVADVATSTFSSPQTLDQAAGLQGSMVLRDPQRERIDQLKTQYGMQFDQRQRLQDDAQAAIAERQRDLTTQRDILKRRGQIFEAEQRASRDVDALASTIAAKTGRTTVIGSDRMMAADMLLKSAALDDDAKAALIKLRGSQGKLAEVEAQGLGTGDTMTAGQGRKEAADARIQKEVDDRYAEYQKVFQQVKPVRDLYQSKLGRLQEKARSLGVEFDEASQTFRGDEAQVRRATFESSMKGNTLLQEIKELGGQLRTLNSQLAGPHDILTKTPAYAKYVEILPSGELRLKGVQPTAPRAKTGGASMAPSPPAAKPLPPVPPVKAPSKYPKGQGPPPIQMPLGAKNPSIQLPKVDLTGARIPSTKEPIPMPAGQASGRQGGYTRGRFSSRRLQQGEPVKLNDDKWYAVEGIDERNPNDPIYRFRLLPQQ